jgi:hypothetical protein
MRWHDLIVTALFAGCGLVLAAAPGRSRSTVQEPQAPVIPDIQEAPAPAAIPMMAAIPAAPSFPWELRVPRRPATPAVPAAPVLPAIPAVPAVPTVPAAPALPASPMEMSLRGGAGSRREGPATDCGDLHIRFHEEAALIESDERTFTKAEARVLHVDELQNGGVQMQGWDKDAYSVTACKAVDASRKDGKELLSEIKFSVQNGHVSVSGPPQHNDWNVYLLIRTPREAEVELTTHNGPASFYKVDGKISARGTNGPISMEACTGEADIEAVNGPISFSGTGGKLRLRTQNGPISVALHGSSWNGGGLEVDAVNGPVSLSLPSGFQSSFLVESRGHSPLSCHASICGDTRKTWDDEHRRIEYGSGTPVIRLTTENGPISINAL